MSKQNRYSGDCIFDSDDDGTVGRSDHAVIIQTHGWKLFIKINMINVCTGKKSRILEIFVIFNTIQLVTVRFLQIGCLP